MAIVISADEIKKDLPNYSPNKAEEFHHESATKADKLFTKALKESSHTKVILLNGGTASGKTEFLSTHLLQEDCIIFDATQSTELGAKNKLRQITKSGKTPIIYSVIPDDLKRAFIAFLNRDRKFSDTHFYKTHAGSRKTVLWIATNYPDIEINIIESSYTLDGKLQFSQIKFDNKQKLFDYLVNKQMSEDDIITYVSLLR
ncbi:hypothetical protein A3D80_03585 [Candidatus Roizmanbacteria bacterium RIFCSPHIGHO2_02_FULL_40_13b]|uniref:Zeta toxin domain-containing protein n=1 Tax=Candidatus Roizmanbacteria bacterium RIFCSPHIGHO2_01_FULL_39_24 TaxID=1802032 RepID=A0A1F7GJX5_9BACT|nr:MAG: hypothetical protein A2799_04225 [Candidatus Roizmanbacteria bacterium RIFCSPHIGHO2_01_FULL_39_24]OGK27047.1 MAG: hypothetical protein A3D80_03585 [Candidatus Roizmanbacteria bacterium RIFCSPHIGHO2_02_FULL_40_13b]OGK48797.1 MAG: hypothetical protein A3A56_01135 [Candidatus Roizmanbacteria bacterium RIFCSPLOWO2_01_FULL_40_32]